MTDRLLSPKTLGPVIATLAVLGLLGYDRFVWRLPAAEAAPYHARMQAAAALVPASVGPWMAEDAPVPEAAVRMLQPNFVVSKRYQNILTGEAFAFLVVQVRDARDILGHYPPVCYPGQGWQPVQADEATWTVDGLRVTGMDYAFARGDTTEGKDLMVHNFLVLPDGTICRNMDEVERAAQDRRRKAFGAAQVQLVYGNAISEERRREITERFIAAAGPLLKELGTGVSR